MQRKCNRPRCSNTLPAAQKSPRCSVCQRKMVERLRKKDPEAFDRTRKARRRVRYADNPKKYAGESQRYRNKLRADFIVAYGGRCTCCGERESAFLTLEHVRRDGSQHRREVGTCTQVLQDLKRRGWPKKYYTILCFNCNRATWLLGTCPHKKEKTHE